MKISSFAPWRFELPAAVNFFKEWSNIDSMASGLLFLDIFVNCIQGDQNLSSFSHPLKLFNARSDFLFHILIKFNDILCELCQNS